MTFLSIKKSINNMKIKHKLIVSFLFVVFVPVLIVGGYLTYQLSEFAYEDAVEQETENMNRVKRRTAEILNTAVKLSNNILFDERLKEIVNTQYKTKYDVVKSYKEFSTFNHYLNSYQEEISTIRFYIDNPTLLNNWQIIPVDKKIKTALWYKNAEHENGLISWSYIADETNNNKENLSMIRKVNFLDLKTYGILVIGVNSTQLDLILSQETSHMMILDDENHIIATNKPNFTLQQINHVMEGKSTDTNELEVFEGKINDEEVHIFIEDIHIEDSLNGLKIVSIIPNKDIVANVKYFGRMGLFVVAISIAIALCLIFYFSKLLSDRILVLSRQINQVGKGNFDIPIHVEGKDEIGQLSQQLNKMVKNTKHILYKIDKMNHQKRLMEQKQNHIKFKMMASQINPHFLFNSLETIRMKASIKGEKEIARIVTLLGKLMRNSIEVGVTEVELNDEIDIVQSYLEIQKFRFGERVNFELNIALGTEKIKIPPLIIQPLVENAIIHGIESVIKGGQIIVNTQWRSEGVYIEVYDNGKGMSAEKLKEIKEILNEQDEKEGARIGLRNVHQRLQLNYKDSRGLVIESELNKGTKISFVIPITERDMYV